MSEKGLCVSCIHDVDCTFSRAFPILQCEEFLAGEPKKAKSVSYKRHNRKKKAA
ncbi:MAG: hypothetical protein ABH843_07740 [Candidatus Omnitrophota bacterium]